MSGLVYTLSWGFINASWTISAISRFGDAATSVVGINLETSSAWEGPDNVTYSLFGSSSLTTCDSLRPVSLSSPLATSTNIWSSFTTCFICLTTLLTACDGTARTIILLSFITLSKSVEIFISFGKITPGKNLEFSLVVLISFAWDSFLVHIWTSYPFLQRVRASALPQLPRPITHTLSIITPPSINLFFFSKFSFCSI